MITTDVKLDYMDEYLKDRVSCLEEQRQNIINCLKVALMLAPPEAKECRHYLEKAIEREEGKNV